MLEHEEIKLVIVEDDASLLGSLTVLFSGEPGIKVSGACRSAEEALKTLEKTVLDLMLVDINLPGMSGIELVRYAKIRKPMLNILIYSGIDDSDTLFSALKAGASGYILKHITPRELIEAVYNIHKGGAPLSPKMARAVIKAFQGEETDEEIILTPKETEVLKTLGKEMSYKEIAHKYKITVNTVHSHIKKIYEKLHAKGKRQALQTARNKGLI